MPIPDGLPALDFSVRVDATRSTVVLGGELDLETACLLAGVVDGQIAQGRVRLRVDLAHVRFMDLDGFDALQGAHRRLAARGGGLVLANAGPLVACLARVSGAEHLLEGSSVVQGAGPPGATAVEVGT